MTEKLVTDNYGAIYSSNCSDAYNITMNSNLFCAKLLTTSVEGTCSQTYDAPLFVRVDALKNDYGDIIPLYYLAGVKSIGTRCNSQPLAFVRPAFFRNWIEKHISEYE